jgi:hypothetical protein
VPLLFAGPGYFQTLRARLIAGRDFTSADLDASAPVVIVNQRFAQQHWPGQSALGKTLEVLPAFPGEPIRPFLTIIGVSSNIVQNDRTRQAFVPAVYVPGAGDQLLIRTRVAPARLILALKREMFAAAPELPAPIWPMDELLAENYAFERDITTLFLAFAAAALLVAAIGLFAALSRAVTQRKREISIRMAVGATPGNILQLILSQGLAPVAAGLVIGITLSVAVNQLLRSQLVAVSPADPLSLTAATLLLLTSAALGCYLPTRRATQIDPAIALRYD